MPKDLKPPASETVEAIVEYEEVGFIKFNDNDLPSGVVDAFAAASALVGLNDCLRFFNHKQARGLSAIPYSVPVRTQPGSWEAVVLGAVGIGTIFGGAYAKKAGEKMAENDFKDIGFRDLFRKSMDALRTLTDLVKKTGKSSGWESGKLLLDKSGDYVTINSLDGEEFLVPVEYFGWYQELPKNFLGKLVNSVEGPVKLVIGSNSAKGAQETVVTSTEKHLFIYKLDEKDDDMLFPDLEHGMEVSLEGRLIRGNAAANSVGLDYMGHVINCLPAMGSVKQFKPALFLRCRVDGMISRFTKQRYVADRRPTLIVDRVLPLEEDGQLGLL